MKKLFIIFFSFLLFVLSTQYAHAHFLKYDKTIGAVMHIDPDDDNPVTNKPETFFFSFKDTTNKFQPNECQCQVKILENGKQIFSQDLFANNQHPSLDNASFSFTFPQRDTYVLQVTGKPNVDNTFQAFNLRWDIHVDKKGITQSPNTVQSFISGHVIHLIGAFGVGIMFIVLLIIQNKRKKNTDHII